MCQMTPPLRDCHEVELFDALNGFADTEKLLMAGDLSAAAVEHGEAAHKVEQAFRPAKRVDRPVLRGNGAAPRPPALQRTGSRSAKSPEKIGVLSRLRSGGDLIERPTMSASVSSSSRQVCQNFCGVPTVA